MLAFAKQEILNSKTDFKCILKPCEVHKTMLKRLKPNIDSCATKCCLVKVMTQHISG